ncbi:Gfo/Idh/MocA family oxidoreductase, partial [Sulfuricurvum sp.]|uniref:Gfo/Idh/MocA family oxidoreductase n=1 Tax=Sulfuricurvum sp. TaxID=2025608 RepID=UPI002E2F0748
MKALIVGYGSIGQRHYDVLSSMGVFDAIHVVTSQTFQTTTTFTTLESVPDIATYDYFVIASETNKHLSQLLYLDSHVKNKTILCEKPLFDTYHNTELLSNAIYVGYVLRFHPIFERIKSRLGTETPIAVSIKSG